MTGPDQSEQVILRELFDKAPLPYQSLDAQRCVQMVNEAWLDMVGYTETEVIGRPFADFVVPWDAELLPKRFSEFLARGSMSGARFEFVRKDGSTVHVVIEGRVARGADSEFLCTHCICRDVTEERVAMDELATSERRFRTLVETAQEGIWQIDAEAHTVYVNPAMARMLGYEVEEMKGKHLFDFMDDRGIEISRQNLDRRQRGLAEQHDFEFRSKDGRQIITTMATAPLTDGEGNYRGAIAGVMDITDRVRYDQKMLDTQKLESLTLMAGGIAHDFNNLLQAIMGNADLALMVSNRDADLEESLQAILTAAGQAGGLCRQMLAFAGKGEYAKEPVRLDQLIHDMTPLLRTSISRKVKLQIHLADEIPPLQADSVQLGQILMNLVTNASEAIGSNEGEVRISVDVREFGEAELCSSLVLEDLEPGTYVILSVQDDGCGMDDKVVAAVCDPFFTTKFAGRGLGMAVVRGVAMGHGGRLRVKSRPKEGTRIEVFLPAGPVSSAMPATENTLSARDRDESVVAGRVLLADDQTEVLAVAKRMLERLGWQVVLVVDGEAAARTVEEDPTGFDLVILDWSMPVLDGHEAMARIRAVAPALPVLVSSGHATYEVQERFAELAPDGFLTKPFKLQELSTAVAVFDAASDRT